MVAPPCEKKIIDLHLECNEGKSLGTAYGSTGFSACMRPRASIYVARCVLGCIAWMCIISSLGRHTHTKMSDKPSQGYNSG